jgi:hypothetical protein
MVEILPELEAYQARLEDRARAWDETGDEDLEADLAQCHQQVELLEKGISEFSAAIDNIPGTFAAEKERVQHRIHVLSQTRDITAAYAFVLKEYITRRARA